MRNLLAFSVLGLLPVLLGAHHSTDANFTREIISVEGDVQQIRFVNPHASVLIKTTAGDGKETFWLLETLGRTSLDRQGISLEQLRIGSRLTATGRKGRREYTMYLHKITDEDGSELILQPGSD